jgi:hypothetical protein
MKLEDEVGRELKASELKPRTVVIIRPPGQNVLITMWVKGIDTKLVVFYSGDLRWGVINFIQPDGSIHDDQGRVVRVYEYLGEI